MLMKSSTQAFICSGLRHASGNLYVFFFFSFFTRTAGMGEREKEGERKEEPRFKDTKFLACLPQPPLLLLSHIASWEQRLSLKSSALPVTSPLRHPLTQLLPGVMQLQIDLRRENAQHDKPATWPTFLLKT